MRKVFDQYEQPENRVTHALMTALNEDRALLRSFLRDLLGLKPPDERGLLLLEQRYPGEDEPSEEELDRRGIPDGWIFNDDGWCVFIESKVLAPLREEQLRRHCRAAKRRGFKEITAVAIAPTPQILLASETVLLEWRQVYAWLCARAPRHPWADCAARYLEITETKLVGRQQLVEGTLTTFAGFPFGLDNRFTYLEGKRVLRLALDELKQSPRLQSQLGMDPSLPGRPAITGRQENGVWDFLSLSGGGGHSFTNHPHLTLSLRAERVEAMVTVPHHVNRGIRRNLVELGEPGFQQLVRAIIDNLGPMLRAHPGAKPWFVGVQRRYLSQRAVPHQDARIEFDLRTAVASSGPPKAQPRWLEAAYRSFVNKRGSNYQIQIGVIFQYQHCPELRQPDAIELVDGAWLACKPLIDLARER